MNAILEAADRMALHIERRHADEHELVRKELAHLAEDLGADDLSIECDGCIAARDYRHRVKEANPESAK